VVRFWVRDKRWEKTWKIKNTKESVDFFLRQKYALKFLVTFLFRTSWNQDFRLVITLAISCYSSEFWESHLGGERLFPSSSLIVLFAASSKVNYSRLFHSFWVHNVESCLSSVDSKRISYDMFKSICLFVLIFLNLIYVCFVFERIYRPSTLAFPCLWLFLSFLVVVPISFLFVYLLVVWTLLHPILLKSFWVINDALRYKTHLLISSIIHACCSCSLLVWTLCLVQMSFLNNMCIIHYLGPYTN